MQNSICDKEKKKDGSLGYCVLSISSATELGCGSLRGQGQPCSPQPMLKLWNNVQHCCLMNLVFPYRSVDEFNQWVKPQDGVCAVCQRGLCFGWMPALSKPFNAVLGEGGY